MPPRLSSSVASLRARRLGTRNALSPSPTLPLLPPAARHDCAPGDRSHAPPGGRARAMTFDGAQQGGEPARTRLSWRRRRARHEPDRSREADESRGPDPSGRGNVENEWNAENESRVRLRSPARRRARRLRRGRRAHEAQPLEQGPQRLAPGVHSHEPPPAPAARTRKDIDGEQRIAGGSLAERHDAHQDGAARTRHQHSVALARI
jgi:hypothetical protein